MAHHEPDFVRVGVDDEPRPISGYVRDDIAEGVFFDLAREFGEYFSYDFLDRPFVPGQPGRFAEFLK